MDIPKEFYKGDNHPEVSSVGELKRQLARLPDDLPIECGFSSGVALVVYNHGDPSMHLEFVEPEA